MSHLRVVYFWLVCTLGYAGFKRVQNIKKQQCLFLTSSLILFGTRFLKQLQYYWTYHTSKLGYKVVVERTQQNLYTNINLD